MSAGIRRILILAGLALLAGCASVSDPGEDSISAEQLQWPPAPQAARIKYLYSISSPADVEKKRGWLGRIWEFVKGKKPDDISRPLGIHADSDGRLYVVDTQYRAVHVFDTKRSRYYRFPEKPIENFVYPVGVTADDHGNVYVADSFSHVVHVFSDYGTKYLKAIGEEQLLRPTGVALRDDTHELLVVDTLASRVVVFDTHDYSIRRVVGSDGVHADALHYPTSIFSAADGSVYVTDTLNFRVQIMSPDFQFVSNYGEVGDGPGYFSRPKGVAVDSDSHIYVVDALFDNIQIFDPGGSLLLTIGSSGHKPGEFWLPNEIFIDDNDRIFVSDPYNSRVQVFQYMGGVE